MPKQHRIFGFAAARWRSRRTQLAKALDVISLGFCVFDARGRLRICNAPYLAMYGLSPGLVRPGCDLDTLLRHRAAAGTYDLDPDQYRAAVAAMIAQGTPAISEIKLSDGRIIKMSQHPMPEGGWVSVHQDVSEQRLIDEQRFAALEGEKRRNWLEEFAASFRCQAETSLHTVAEHAAATRRVAKELLTHSGETMFSAGTALEKSHKVMSAVTTVSSAASELATSIGEIAHQLGRTAEAVHTAVEDAEQTGIEIDHLADAGQKIGDVVTLINHIAGQTNLLALNATIEAARAGAAGRGFAVVASEVKSLSVQTAKATEDISRQINSLRESAEVAVQAIERITTRIKEIDHFASEAASALQQQDIATTEISRNAHESEEGLNAVVGMLTTVTDDALKTSASAKSVLSASNAVEVTSTTLHDEVEEFLRRTIT
jgi:methyl-accepting chemotaxis protein